MYTHIYMYTYYLVYSYLWFLFSFFPTCGCRGQQVILSGFFF